MSKKYESPIPPFRGLSTVLSRKGGRDSASGAGTARFQKPTQLPGVAASHGAAAAGTAVTWLARLQPAISGKTTELVRQSRAGVALPSSTSRASAATLPSGLPQLFPSTRPAHPLPGETATARRVNGKGFLL